MFSCMSHCDAASSDEGRKVEYREGEKFVHLLIGGKAGGKGRCVGGGKMHHMCGVSDNKMEWKVHTSGGS